VLLAAVRAGRQARQHLGWHPAESAATDVVLNVCRRTFYPHLKLPEDQLDTPIVTTSSRGRTFDFRLELREDMPEAWSVGESGEGLTGATGQPRTQYRNLQRVI